MPCGLHCAISGGILGFGTADRLLLFLHLHRDLAVMSGWLCVCFLQDLSLIHRHTSCPSSPEHVHCHGVIFCVSGLCFGLLFWVVVLVCFCLHPRLDFLDCVMVHALFKLPNEGCCWLCTIRTMAQTLCYNLARAEKRRTEKKFSLWGIKREHRPIRSPSSPSAMTITRKPKKHQQITQPPTEKTPSLWTSGSSEDQPKSTVNFSPPVQLLTHSIVAACNECFVVSYYAEWLALWDLGGPGWGDPWPQCAVLFCLDNGMTMWCLCFFVLSVLFTAYQHQRQYNAITSHSITSIPELDCRSLVLAFSRSCFVLVLGLFCLPSFWFGCGRKYMCIIAQFVQMAQTMYYELARAEKATDGKKGWNICVLISQFTVSLQLAIECVEWPGESPRRGNCLFVCCPVILTCLVVGLFVRGGTEEARTCEAWFQLTFRPQKWNLKAHMWYQLSMFPSSNAAIAMQHHPGNIHQSVATPRLLRYSVACFNSITHVLDTISKRWRSKKAFNTSPFHIFP